MLSSQSLQSSPATSTSALASDAASGIHHDGLGNNQTDGPCYSTLENRLRSRSIQFNTSRTDAALRERSTASSRKSSVRRLPSPPPPRYVSLSLSCGLLFAFCLCFYILFYLSHTRQSFLSALGKWNEVRHGPWFLGICLSVLACRFSIACSRYTCYVFVLVCLHNASKLKSLRCGCPGPPRTKIDDPCQLVSYPIEIFFFLQIPSLSFPSANLEF